MDALVTSGSTAPSMVSFHLSTDTQDNGEVTFGGLDASKFTGNIQFLPLASKSFWLIDFSQTTFKIAGARGGSVQGSAAGSFKKAIAGNQVN